MPDIIMIHGVRVAGGVAPGSSHHHIRGEGGREKGRGRIMMGVTTVDQVRRKLRFLLSLSLSFPCVTSEAAPMSCNSVQTCVFVADVSARSVVVDDTDSAALSPVQRTYYCA